MLNFSAVVKPSMMTTQGVLSFQYPILHPRSSPCPLLSKPNRIMSYNYFHASPRYQSLAAHSARAAQPVSTPKSLATDFLYSPSEDRNRRDLDCRYLQEKRLEGKRTHSSDDYYPVSEPRFNELVRGDSDQHKRRVDDHDLVDGDSAGGWSFGLDHDDDDDEDDDDKPVPEPSLDDLLALYKFSQSNDLHPQ